MKKYFYFAAALLFAAISCTKETPDTNTELPDAGKQSGRKTIVLNIAGPDTKTYVSDPATGTISWETGDVVGVFTDKDVTEPLPFTLSGEPGTSATFTGEVSEGATELYVFYPYNASATFADGKITTELPSVQSVGANNVAQGAMVSLGQATKTGAGTYSAALHNAFSYIKFKITGDDVKEIVLSGGADKLAGTATFSVADGTMTGTGTVSSIRATKAGGYFTKDTYYYIPVLPGNVAALSFSMTSNTHGTDTGTTGFDDWKAERVAGSALTFTRGTGLKFDALDQGSKWSWYFDIRDAASLERFRALVAAGTFPAAGVAKMTSDIDLSGVTLAAAAGTFKGTLDGQGHTITNWTSNGVSLLNLVPGTVKDFTLDSSCNLQFNATPGASFGFVCVDVQSGGVLDGVTNNASITQSVSVTGAGSAVLAPLAGRSYGLVQNCTNNGNVAITATAASQNVYLGGIVGFVNAGEGLALFKNTNNGDIAYRVNAKGANVYIGGIAAGTSTAAGIDKATSSKGTVDLCLNTGNISYYCTNGGSMEDNAGTGGTGNYCKVAGIVGYWEGNITNCVNGIDGDASKGIVSVTVPTSDSAACSTAPSFGGIAGFALRNITDCTNYGTVRVKGTFAGGNTANAGCGSQKDFCVGGIVGQAGPATATNDYSVSGCKNYGELDYTGWMASENGTFFYYGGVAGWLNIPISGCKNYGSMTVSSKGARTVAGGVIAYGERAASDLENYGALDVCLLRTVSSGGQSNNSYHRIGGVIGHSKTNLSASVNHGKLTVRGDANPGKYAPLIGGIAGQAEGGFASSNSNEGDVDVHWPADGTYGLIVGGAIGWTGLSISDVSNSGNVIVEGGTHAEKVEVGGVIGHVSGGTHTGHNNSGKVSFTGTTVSAKLFVGGVIGWKAGSANISNLTASEISQPITVNVANQNEQFFVGGIVGRSENTSKTWSGMKNYKPIDVTISSTSRTDFSYIGGVSGSDQANQTYTSNENYGDISYTGPTKIRLGGIVPYTNQATSSCTATCKIIANCTSNHNSEVGGVVGYTAATGFTSDSFKGVINTSGSSAKVYTGGILGKSNGATQFNGCSFGGSITGADGNNVPGLYVGGLQANNLAMTFGATSKCVVATGSKVNGVEVISLTKDNLVSQSSDGGTFVSTATLTNIVIE